MKHEPIVTINTNDFIDAIVMSVTTGQDAAELMDTFLDIIKPKLNLKDLKRFLEKREIPDDERKEALADLMDWTGVDK